MIISSSYGCWVLQIFKCIICTTYSTSNSIIPSPKRIYLCSWRINCPYYILRNISIITFIKSTFRICNCRLCICKKPLSYRGLNCLPALLSAFPLTVLPIAVLLKILSPVFQSLEEFTGAVLLKGILVNGF